MALTQQANLHVNEWVDVVSNASPETLGAAKTIYGIEVDNSQNSDAVYLKVYDNASPTVGTTAPDAVIKCPGGSTRRQTLGVPGAGIAFVTDVSFACVTDPGTGGTTGPTNAVKVTFWTN